MTMLFTPGGMINTDRVEVRLPPEYLQMLAAFAETSGEIELGLHCAICKQDLVGKNARADRKWIMECACRTFVGGNPLKGTQH
jgi:hypothetical protein